MELFRQKRKRKFSIMQSTMQQFSKYLKIKSILNLMKFKKLKCGHNCSLVCHSGKCSSENDCLEKVIIKCKCKTVKKNFACNKTKNDSSIIVSEKGFVLKCSEKCKSKQSQKDMIEDDEKTLQKAENKTNETKKFKILISILILSLALILGYFFSY